LRDFTKQSELTKEEYGALLAIGSSSLLVNFLIKKLMPTKVLDKIYTHSTKIVDEDSKKADDNKLLNAFNKVSEQKVEFPKKANKGD